MTVISLLTIPYIHRVYVCMYGFGQPYVYVALANPTEICVWQVPGFTSLRERRGTLPTLRTS